MIEIPVENKPCKSFSVMTPIGVLRLRTYWNGMASMWYMDLLDKEGNGLVSGIALATGTNNLISGTGIPELEGCAMFVVDTSGNGNKTFDGFGDTTKLFMTFAGETIEYY
jgi:hypothetical protein